MLSWVEHEKSFITSGPGRPDLNKNKEDVEEKPQSQDIAYEWHQVEDQTNHDRQYTKKIYMKIPGKCHNREPAPSFTTKRSQWQTGPDNKQNKNMTTRSHAASTRKVLKERKTLE